MPTTTPVLPTEIASTNIPETPATPKLNQYETPNVSATESNVDKKNFEYKSPTGTGFTANNINSGLLEYDPTESNKLTFDGHDVNADALAIKGTAQLPTYATSDKFLTDGAFVENRVNNLMSEDSLTMKRAKAQGMADAGSRGLQNTSMGATIGQSVMADKAIQIATPDAATQAQGDLSRQNATYSSQKANQDTTNQGSLAQQTAKINSALSSQTAGQNWDSTKQKAAIQGELNVQGAEIAGAQATQAAKYASDARIQEGLLEGASTEQQARVNAELKNIDSQSAQNLSILNAKLEAANATTADQNKLIIQQFADEQNMLRTVVSAEFTKAVNQAQLNTEQRKQLAAQMTTMANNYEISIQNIMLDPNLNAAAKNAAIANMKDIYNKDMSSIASVFGTKVSSTGLVTA